MSNEFAMYSRLSTLRVTDKQLGEAPPKGGVFLCLDTWLIAVKGLLFNYDPNTKPKKPNNKQNLYI